MSSKQVISAEFIEIFGMLFEMIISFDNNSFIKRHKDVFLSVIKHNPTITIEQFIIKVMPYHEKIKAKDAGFFLEKDYKDDLKDIDNVANKSDTILEYITKLKSIWKDLDTDDRNTIFFFMEQLCEKASAYFQLVA